MSAATAIALPAQTFTTLYSFQSTDGASPQAALLQATDGNLYGTTSGGGANGQGTIFKISNTGTLTTLYSFAGTDGANPVAALVQGTDGNFYGTTYSGGAYNSGTVFKITPTGTLTTLHSFAGTDGANPGAALVQANNGSFYGSTEGGGANDSCTPYPGCGTVFKITSTGTLTTLFSFDGPDGNVPGAAMIQATDGNLYGTAIYGGLGGSGQISGTIFKLTLSGTLTTVYNFCSGKNCPDGGHPFGGLVQATNGNFYGTASQGGVNNQNAGIVFEANSGPKGGPNPWDLTTLYSFCAERHVCPDGEYPHAGLVQATDGNFYGTTFESGANGAYGTVFEISASGALTTLYSFCSQAGCTDGDLPAAALVQDTNGTFYGTTEDGGANGNYGTIFSLSVGLGPFLGTLPTSGKVGTAVKILGTNLTGATSVTFNGTAAVFKVVSSSEITTTVPTGATTGTVEVVTPGGTLSSNVSFQVP